MGLREKEVDTITMAILVPAPRRTTVPTCPTGIL